MGSSSRLRLKVEQFDEEIDQDSEVVKQKEHSYKLFQLGDDNVRTSNGEFRCPFCASKDEPDHDYTHLLQHAIRVAEGSITGEKRAKHSAMVRYLAIDLADQFKPQPQQPDRKRSRSDSTKNDSASGSKAVRTPRVNAQKVAMAEKKEKEALDKARVLETKIAEMRDETNALITKERSANHELQEVRKELIKGLSEIQRGNNVDVHIGIKKVGELDPPVFIRELKMRMPPGEDIEIKGTELCSLWQNKIKDPRWYPFQIIEDGMGKSQRLLKEDDVTLQALKEEWGKEIHDVVVEALTDLQEYNPSGCYTVPELWNLTEKRKASLHEVVRDILQRAGKGKGKPQKRFISISQGM